MGRCASVGKIAVTAAVDRTSDGAGLDGLEERIEQAIAHVAAQIAADDQPPPPRLPKQIASMTDRRERGRSAGTELVAGEQTRINLTSTAHVLLLDRVTSPDGLGMWGHSSTP